MKASVILAHPYMKSFNHSIFFKVLNTLKEKKIECFSHDLYQEKFHPILTENELGSDKSDDPLVNLYSRELLQSQLLIFIHPNWWGQPPAILKGYIDRIIRPPYAYDFPDSDSGGGLPLGKLKGKFGLVFNTSNTEELRENTVFGDPLERIWRDCIFGFCGITDYSRKIFRIIADSSIEERTKWLKETGELIIKIVDQMQTD